MVATSEKLRPRWGADRADVETINTRPICSEGIHIRSREIRISRMTQITPSLIVSEDDDDVWLAGCDKEGAKKEQEEGARKEKEGTSRSATTGKRAFSQRKGHDRN